MDAGLKAVKAKQKFESVKTDRIVGYLYKDIRKLKDKISEEENSLANKLEKLAEAEENICAPYHKVKARLSRLFSLYSLKKSMEGFTPEIGKTMTDEFTEVFCPFHVIELDYMLLIFYCGTNHNKVNKTTAILKYYLKSDYFEVFLKDAGLETYRDTTSIKDFKNDDEATAYCLKNQNRIIQKYVDVNSAVGEEIKNFPANFNPSKEFSFKYINPNWSRLTFIPVSDTVAAFEYESVRGVVEYTGENNLSLFLVGGSPEDKREFSEEERVEAWVNPYLKHAPARIYNPSVKTLPAKPIHKEIFEKAFKNSPE